jgi:hypothetical protein
VFSLPTVLLATFIIGFVFGLMCGKGGWGDA